MVCLILCILLLHLLAELTVVIHITLIQLSLLHILFAINRT